jgi:hypothetical protein
MGESRLKRLAGTAWEVEIFDPASVLLSARPDQTRVAALGEAARRHFRRPTPRCACCSAEFLLGARPALLFTAKPMFARGRIQFVGGSICETCSERDAADIQECVIAGLRENNPGIMRVKLGVA